MSLGRPLGRGFLDQSRSMGGVVHLVLVRVEDNLEALVDVRLVVRVLQVSWRGVRAGPVEADGWRERRS